MNCLPHYSTQQNVAAALLVEKNHARTRFDAVIAHHPHETGKSLKVSWEEVGTLTKADGREERCGFRR